MALRTPIPIDDWQPVVSNQLLTVSSQSRKLTCPGSKPRRYPQELTTSNVKKNLKLPLPKPLSPVESTKGLRKKAKSGVAKAIQGTYEARVSYSIGGKNRRVLESLEFNDEYGLSA